MFTLDNDIIYGCLQEDRRAQTKLYEKYHITLRKVVDYYISCPYIGEEILNDGFIRIFAKIKLYEGKGSFEGWMKKIMLHAVSDAIKADNRIQTAEKKGWGRKGSRIDIDTIHESLQVKWQDKLGVNDITRIINRLPYTTCTVFKMYLEGLKHMEIAKIMNISEGTSKWHVNEARKKLNMAIKKG